MHICYRGANKTHQSTTPNRSSLEMGPEPDSPLESLAVRRYMPLASWREAGRGPRTSLTPPPKPPPPGTPDYSSSSLVGRRHITLIVTMINIKLTINM